MKWAAVCLMGAALMATPWQASTWAAVDDLEDLLNIESAAPLDDAAQSPSSQEDYAPLSGASSYDANREWNVPDDSAVRSIAPASVPAVGSVESASEPRSSLAAPINAVPEPSAWLLAIAALLYFVIFGRRRRLV